MIVELIGGRGVSAEKGSMATGAGLSGIEVRCAMHVQTACSTTRRDAAHVWRRVMLGVHERAVCRVLFVPLGRRTRNVPDRADLGDLSIGLRSVTYSSFRRELGREAGRFLSNCTLLAAGTPRSAGRFFRHRGHVTHVHGGGGGAWRVDFAIKLN